MQSVTKLGLALSGGGAKGAYHAGVVRYLAEKNIQPDAVAGASIGALNGAVVASATDIHQATKDLEKVWRFVADKSPVKVDSVAIMVLLLRMLLQFGTGPKGKAASLGLDVLKPVLPEKYKKYLDDVALLENAPSIDILEKYARLEADDDGLPFWVSAYRSDGAFTDVVKYLKAELTFSDTKDSDFIFMNALPQEDKLRALLASSAIPVAYERQSLDGVKYSDGGLGGVKTAQGNTPISPLIEHEKCSHIIVTHLQDGSMWDRHRFPEATILEIRPSGIAKDGVRDLLKFEKSAIMDWMHQGYEDTKATIEALGYALESFASRKSAVRRLERSVGDMAHALDWLKK